MAPDPFAGVHLKSVNPAIPAPGDQKTLPIDHSDHGRGVIGVSDGKACGTPPNNLAGIFVDGKEAIVANGLFTPAGIDYAKDDQVAVDDWAGNAAPVATNAAKFLGKGFLPNHLEVFVETKKQSLGAVCIDVARFGVATNGRPPQPNANNVGVKHIKAMLGHKFSGVGIKTNHPLLFMDPFPVTADKIGPPILNDRGGATAIGGFPTEIVPFGGGVWGPFFRKPGVVGHPVLGWSAPMGPLSL